MRLIRASAVAAPKQHEQCRFTHAISTAQDRCSIPSQRTTQSWSTVTKQSRRQSMGCAQSLTSPCRRRTLSRHVAGLFPESDTRFFMTSQVVVIDFQKEPDGLIRKAKVRNSPEQLEGEKISEQLNECFGSAFAFHGFGSGPIPRGRFSVQLHQRKLPAMTTLSWNQSLVKAGLFPRRKFRFRAGCIRSASGSRWHRVAHIPTREA